MTDGIIGAACIVIVVAIIRILDWQAKKEKEES